MIASTSRNDALFENEMNSSVVVSFSEALFNALKLAVNSISNLSSDLVEPFLLSSEIEGFFGNFSKNIDFLDKVLSEKLFSSLVLLGNSYCNTLFILNLLETH